MQDSRVSATLRVRSPRCARRFAPHQAANATPMPTTAAVSAKGSHVCAVLRNISVIIPPTPSARRRKAAGAKSEPVACTLLAGGGRLRVPGGNICGCVIIRNANRPFFSGLWSQCDFRVTLRRTYSAVGTPHLVGRFGCRALPLAQEAAPVGGNGSGPTVLVGPLLFVSKMRIAVTICLGTHLICGR